MVGQDPTPRYPRQFWLVIVLALVLIALVVSVALGFAPGGVRQGAASAPSSTISSRPSSTPSTTPTLVRSATPASSATPEGEHTTALTATPSASPTATRTPRPSATPSATPAITDTPPPTPTPAPTDIPREDHYWLERPISAQANNVVGRFYPYASRLDGSYPIHHGVEFVNPMGTAILATAPGTIVAAGDDLTQVYGARTNFYGLLIVQQLERPFLGQPVYVLYGHLSEIRVPVGQTVQSGDTIGLVGMTGVAEGPHLHMEVRYGQNAYSATVNPELWVRPREGFGTLAGALLSVDGQPVADEAKIVLYRPSDLDKPVYDVITYPAKEVNPDPEWAENFAMGELEAGNWVAKVYRGQRLYTEEFSVTSGATTWLTIRLRQ